MNALATFAATTTLEQQVRAVEAEIAATRARMNARLGDQSYRPNADADHLQALRAAGATLRHLQQKGAIS